MKRTNWHQTKVTDEPIRQDKTGRWNVGFIVHSHWTTAAVDSRSTKRSSQNRLAVKAQREAQTQEDTGEQQPEPQYSDNVVTQENSIQTGVSQQNSSNENNEDVVTDQSDKRNAEGTHYGAADNDEQPPSSGGSPRVTSPRYGKELLMETCASELAVNNYNNSAFQSTQAESEGDSLVRVGSVRSVRIAEGLSPTTPDPDALLISDIPSRGAESRDFSVYTSSVASAEKQTISESPQILNSPRSPGGAPSILKNSDNNIIKRPLTRSKSVTFSRSASEVNFFNQNIAILDQERRKEENNDTDSATSKQETSESPQGPGGAIEAFLKRHGIGGKTEESTYLRVKPQRRPSSSGPAFKRAVKTIENVQKFTNLRKKNFFTDKIRAETSDEPLGQGNSSNLPKGAAFHVRRDSILSKTLPKLYQEEDKGAEEEPFETYIIRNGRLLRRDSGAGRRGSHRAVGGRPEMNRRPSSRSLMVDEKKGRTDELDAGHSPLVQTHPQSKPEQVSADNGSAKSNTIGANAEATVEPSGGGGDQGGDQKSNTNTSVVNTWDKIKEVVTGTTVVGRHGEIQRWSSTRQEIVTESIPIEPSGATVPVPTVQEIPDSLRKLGFRKVEKGKKKKSGTKSKKGSKKDGEENKRTVINLKEDPLLIKVSRKNRNVGRFKEPPKSRPFAVCFEVQDAKLTHGQVKKEIEMLMQGHAEVQLAGIQFEHRSLMYDVSEMDNRWIIDTTSLVGRNRLAGNQVTFGNFTTMLRRYDDVINGEYQQYIRMMNFVKMMNSRKILAS